MEPSSSLLELASTLDLMFTLNWVEVGESFNLDKLLRIQMLGT